jgi:hypothetical protein
VAVVGGIRREG